MALFFFFRSSPAPYSGKYLVSGVVEAATEDDAIAQLGAALRRGKSQDDAQNFVFQDLATTPPAKTDGLIVIITAEEKP